MNYSFLPEDDALIVKIEGDFLVGKIKNFLSDVIKESSDYESVILDFSGVNFIDSYGIGILLSLLKELKKKDKELKICSLNKSVKNIFKKLQVYSFFEIYETCDDALI